MQRGFLECHLHNPVAAIRTKGKVAVQVQNIALVPSKVSQSSERYFLFAVVFPWLMAKVRIVAKSMWA